MPQIKSAIKRLRQNKKSRDRNHAQRARLKSSINKFLSQIEKKESEQADITLKQVYSLLDRAAGNGVVKRNYASRQKKRLARKSNALSS